MDLEFWPCVVFFFFGFDFSLLYYRVGVFLFFFGIFVYLLCFRFIRFLIFYRVFWIWEWGWE
jgi:hypothetical protein